MSRTYHKRTRLKETIRHGTNRMHVNETKKFKRLLQSKAWTRYRRGFILQNPFCIECMTKGNPTPTQIVDHIKPWRTHPELFWEATNHQPLCIIHHNQKTNREEGGFGRPKLTFP